MSMKRFSARFFKEVLCFRGAYSIPHSLLSRRSRAGPEDAPALLSVEEPEKRLLSAVFPAEKGSGTNLIGFFEALVEPLAGRVTWGLKSILESYHLRQVVQVRSSLPSLRSESRCLYKYSGEARSTP